MLKKTSKEFVDQYISLYIIDKVVSTNAVKLQLPTSIKIHLAINVSWVVRYREQVEGQKAKKVKLVKMNGVKEWKIEKILNKRKIKKEEK